MPEVEDVPVGVGVGRLERLQGEGAVVEGQPAEVHVVGVVEAPRRLLSAPLVLPFCGGDVAAERFASLNLTSLAILREVYSQFVSLMLFLSHFCDLMTDIANFTLLTFTLSLSLCYLPITICCPSGFCNCKTRQNTEEPLDF